MLYQTLTNTHTGFVMIQFIWWLFALLRLFSLPYVPRRAGLAHLTHLIPVSVDRPCSLKSGPFLHLMPDRWCSYCGNACLCLIHLQLFASFVSWESWTWSPRPVLHSCFLRFSYIVVYFCLPYLHPYIALPYKPCFLCLWILNRCPLVWTVNKPVRPKCL